MSIFSLFGARSKPKKSAKKSSRKPAMARRKWLGHEQLENRDLLTLLGVDPGFPLVTYNSTGQVHYTPASNSFDLTATPLAFKASGPSDPANIGAPASMALHIKVDNTGHLIGGVPGDDLVITGAVNDGTTNVSGVLLTGEVTAFGYADSGTTDAYDFRFTVTGGALASLFATKDIGITTTSEHSTFTGNFATAFDGGAKGNIGSVDQVTGNLSGHKFVDSKGKGNPADYVPTGGVTIQLFRDGNNSGSYEAAQDGPVVATTVTSPGTGAYSFSNLQPGRYFVKEVVPAGYKETTPASVYYTVVVAAGSNTQDLDFVNTKDKCDNHKCNPDPCVPKPCDPKPCKPNPCDNKGNDCDKPKNDCKPTPPKDCGKPTDTKPCTPPAPTPPSNCKPGSSGSSSSSNSSSGFNTNAWNTSGWGSF